MKSIFHYTDARKYLKNWFKKSGLSHRQVSAYLGAESSSYLFKVLNNNKGIPALPAHKYEKYIKLYTHVSLGVLAQY